MAKTREQKEQLMNLYKEIIDRQAFVIVRTNRIPANALNAYRNKIREYGARMHILKNKIFAKAVQNIEGLKEIEYTEQLAIIDGGDDIVAALKALETLQETAKELHLLAGMDEDAAKEYKAYDFYMGYLDGNVLDAEDVKRLKDLPSKESLLAQLVGTLAAPLTGFMSVLNGNTRKFIYALKDLETKKA